MIAEKSDRRHASFGLAAVFFLGVATAWVLWSFPPERYGFYPTCPIREYLHIECPGCGATRAIAALLHGRLAEALRQNALVVGTMLPLAVVYAGMSLARCLRGEELRWPIMPRTATFALLGVAAAFTLMRNF